MRKSSISVGGFPARHAPRIVKNIVQKSHTPKWYKIAMDNYESPAEFVSTIANFQAKLCV